MNWKLRLVLLFSRLGRPISPATDIRALRRKADASAWLGSLLFDSRMEVAAVTEVDADGVPLRIYQHTIAPGRRVIVYYHGGGFVLYGPGSHDYVCRRLSAMNDCIVVSVDYRLAPEQPFPAAHDDAYTALRWVISHIARYGGDPGDIVVAGDSAGGNLSACMAHRCRREGIRLTAQVLIYPWIDGRLDTPSIARNGEGYMLTRETMFWFQRQYTPRPEDRCVPAVSPCYETEFAGLAPVYILTAELDPLLDDGHRYHLQLQQHGVQSSYREYKGLIHGFINIPLVDDAAMEAFDDISRFLRGIPAPALQPAAVPTASAYDLTTVKTIVYDLAKKINAPEAFLPAFAWSVEDRYVELDRAGDIHYISRQNGQVISDQVAHHAAGLIDQEIDEMLYSIFSSVTFSMAVRHEADHPDQSGSPSFFKKQEELLGVLNVNWQLRREKEHNKILADATSGDLHLG